MMAIHFRLLAGACALALLPLSACTTTQTTAEVAQPLTVQSSTYTSFDGQDITYMRMGNGPIVLMLHGFTSNAKINWFDSGIAQQVAAAGYTVIAPDTRGHGASQVPDSPRSWPRDAVARDQIALVKELNEKPVAVVGYSMGSLTAMRYHLLTRDGGRLLLGGVGDSAADEWNTDRSGAFKTALDAAIGGSDVPGALAFVDRARTSGSTLEGYRGALTSRKYTGADLLATFDVPVLVVTGDQDTDNGTGSALAEIIPGARYTQITGTHGGAVSDPAFPGVIISFLNEGR